MRRLLPLALALLALTSIVVGTVGVGPWTRSEPTRRTAATTTAAPVETLALRVLHGWDERRARAWSDAAPRRLTRLYVPGSPSAAADRAMLEAYRARGLRVVAMRRQTLSVRVVHESPRRLTLRVTDRLTHAMVAGVGVRRRLPRGGFSTRTLTFRRTDGGWVLAG
jgi:hypothetical protein